MAGGSRAAKRRERKRRLVDEEARSGDVEPNSQATRDIRAPGTADCSDEHRLAPENGAVVVETGSTTTEKEAVAKQAIETGSGVSKDTAIREWMMPVTAADETLVECIALALQQADAITGRKYRYGATLMAGEDHIPLRSGSNKKQFLRDNIHAEICALKGCKVPAGKDMMIGRLAPVPRARDGEGGEDGDVGDGRQGESQWMQRLVSKEKTTGDQRFKILNARPCEACEKKMQKRGVRRCYYTVSKEFLGVIDLQVAPEANRESKLDFEPSPPVCTSLQSVHTSALDSATT